MAEYKSRIFVKVFSRDGWKRFESFKFALGKEFNAFSNEEDLSFCIDRAWGCPEGDIDRLVTNIAKVLGQDGFIIADTVDLDSPAYTYAVVYMGEEIHTYYFGSYSNNRYLYENVEISNYNRWLGKVYSEAFLNETENEYLAQYGILIENSVGTIVSEELTEDLDDKIYIYCDVLPENYQNTWCYIADYPAEVGDIVVIPIRAIDNLKVGIVLNVYNCSASKAPWPVRKTKHIFRKFSKEDASDRKLALQKKHLENQFGIQNLTEEQRIAAERRRLKQEQKSNEARIQTKAQPFVVNESKSSADELSKFILEVELFIKYYEKSWKKDVKTTNAEILGSLPLTRSNDARIRKMITNTESILSKYADDMIDKCHRLDEMGQKYRQGVVEDNVVIHICEILHSMVESLNMSHTLQFPKQTHTAQYTVPNELKDMLTRWKRYRSNLPSVKIQKLEEPLLQNQLALESWTSKLNSLKSEENDFNAKITSCNEHLVNKKNALNEALAIESEFEQRLSDTKSDMSNKITMYDAELQIIQSEKSTLDLNKAKCELSQATTMYDSNISITQEKIDQLNMRLKEEKAEEALAKESAEKAFLFKKKKQELAFELSQKVVATQVELDEAQVKLGTYNSQKATVIASLNAKISDIQSKLDILNKQIAKVTEDKKSAEAQIRKAEQEYESKVLIREQACQAYEGEKKVLATLEKKQRKNKKAVSEAETEIQLLSKTIEEAYQEIAKIKEKADLARQKIR